jgi:hypothetical protein
LIVPLLVCDWLSFSGLVFIRQGANESSWGMFIFVKRRVRNTVKLQNEKCQGSADENQVIPTPKYHIAKLYRILLYPYQKCI